MMLVLTRNAGESIHIGPDVEFKIISTGNRVKIGIEAPPAIRILRGEIRARQEQATDGDPQGDRPGSRLAVLIVEDNPVHAKIIAHTLSRQAVSRIAVASSGEEAVQNLWDGNGVDSHVGRPNLVLLDLGLPGMSGLDVLVRIKSDEQLRKTPVVVLSSTQESLEVERCLNAGANAFVTKSPDPAEMRSSLSRIADFWGMECRTHGHCNLN